MKQIFCIAEHSEDNTTITVRRRKGDRGVTFPIEFGSGSASMIAARKYFATRGIDAEPIDQCRDRKLETRGIGYAVRVRCFV